MTAFAPALSSASRKARLVGAYLCGEPVPCTWQLSPRCESFCHICDHRADASVEELDAAACAAVAAKLGRSASLIVSYTGSEPFLREDLAAIVSSVAARHFPLLVTNGWLVTRSGRARPGRRSWRRRRSRSRTASPRRTTRSPACPGRTPARSARSSAWRGSARAGGNG